MSDKNMTCGFSENFEFLVNELSNQQKEQQKSTSDLASAVNISARNLENLESKIEEVITEKFKNLEEAFSKKIDDLRGTNPQVDTSSLKNVLQKGITDLKILLSAYPKNVTKKIKILLFPEQDAKLFYKIVFGRWFMWLVIIVFLNFLYNWALHWSNNNKQLMEDTIKSNREIKAWNYLYKQSKKETRRLMDSAWVKSADK